MGGLFTDETYKSIRSKSWLFIARSFRKWFEQGKAMCGDRIWDGVYRLEIVGFHRIPYFGRVLKDKYCLATYWVIWLTIEVIDKSVAYCIATTYFSNTKTSNRECGIPSIGYTFLRRQLSIPEVANLRRQNSQNSMESQEQSEFLGDITRHIKYISTVISTWPVEGSSGSFVQDRDGWVVRRVLFPRQQAVYVQGVRAGNPDNK